MAIYKETGLVHCYTMECNYHNGKKNNRLTPAVDVQTGATVPDTEAQDVNAVRYGRGSPPFDIELMEDAGRAAGVALLDIIEANPISRIETSAYRNLDNVRSEIEGLVCNSVKVRRGRGLGWQKNNPKLASQKRSTT